MGRLSGRWLGCAVSHRPRYIGSNELELLECESIPAVYVALENLPTRMWEADKLLLVRSRAFHVKNLN